jgi:hypothetical protein
MTDKKTITINGQHYDAVTGLPAENSSSESTSDQPRHHTPAVQLHGTPQRSVTLHRKSLKKPMPAIVKRNVHAASVHKSMDIHPNVRRFAPHPVGAITPRPVQKIDDNVHIPHPHVVKAHAQSAAKADSLTSRLPTASEKKDAAVQHAVANTHKQHKTHRLSFNERFKPRQRITAVLSAAFAVVLLGGYFTYLNMPALSVRVAAAQAGIDANYPNYRPDGYSLTGPVTFSDGRVAMNFQANGGNKGFSISQSKSGWNNEAVLDNYVSPRAGVNYIPYTERGLTIYTFDDSAAWVNGGILYTIDGDAPLSSEQIRRIATSLL